MDKYVLLETLNTYINEYLKTKNENLLKPIGRIQNKLKEMGCRLAVVGSMPRVIIEGEN